MSATTSATQEFVPIKEVRDGVVLLKDGGMRSILLCSSLNFALKSEDERQAILLQFQDLLNSLDFSIEIVIQSRKLDIRPYIALLEGQEKAQTNSLMKIQVREYIEFIRSFTENTNIMTKNFFIVIPYDAAIVSTKKGILSSFSNKKESQETKHWLRMLGVFDSNLKDKILPLWQEVQSLTMIFQKITNSLNKRV